MYVERTAVRVFCSSPGSQDSPRDHVELAAGACDPRDQLRAGYGMWITGMEIGTTFEVP